MKSRRLSVPLLALLMLAAGCASPMEKAYTTRSLYNEGLRDLIAARENHLVSDAAYVQAVKAADVVPPVLDELDTAALSGNPIRFTSIYSNARSKLSAFLVSLTQAKKGK
jgi:transcriptional regulator NrdR family protein